MAITAAQTIQYPAVASVSFTYADLTSGTVEDLCQVPAGATVIGGEIIIDTAWDSGTSDTFDIGDGDDDDRYTSTIIDLQSTAGTRVALTVTGYKYTETDTIDGTPTSVGTAATAGAARVNIMYVVEDRGHEVQG